MNCPSGHCAPCFTAPVVVPAYVPSPLLPPLLPSLPTRISRGAPRPKMKPETRARRASNSSDLTAAATLTAEETNKDTGSDHPYLTWRVFMMGLLVSLGGFIFGYDAGQIAGFIVMKAFRRRFGERDPAKDEYYLPDTRAGLFVSVLSIGGLFGALIAGPVANRFGRRKPITFWCLIYIVGIIIQISSSTKWQQIVIGKAIGGLGVGALSITVPLYQSETAPTHIRSSVLCLFQIYITFGILLANIVNYPSSHITSTASWRIAMGIGFLAPLLLGLSILLFPESPIYAYRNNAIPSAAITMTKLLGVSSQFHPTINFELAQLQKKLDSENGRGQKKRAWHEFVTGPSMLHRTLLGVSLMAFQQLSGANFFLYYGTALFSTAGIESPFITQIILVSVNLVCTLPGLYFVSHFSRRKCLIVGGLVMSTFLLIFASVGHFVLLRGQPKGEGLPGSANFTQEHRKEAGTVMIVFASLFIATFASTWGPMVWSSVAELYPSRYRATCIGLATASNWMIAFYIAFCTPFIISEIDYLYGYVFAGTCAAASVTVYFFLMESQGRGLEELDNMYLAKVKPWQSAKWIAPLDHDTVERERKGSTRVKEDGIESIPESPVRERDDGVVQGTETV